MIESFCMRGMALAGSLVIAGCAAVGPNFQPPMAAADMPKQFAQQHSQTEAAQALPDSRNVHDAAFWSQFGDAQLSQLVQQALHTNQDVGAAMARLQLAEAVLTQSQLDRLPTLTMAAAATQQTQQVHGSAPGNAGPTGSTRSYSASIAANWEIDWAGRVRRAVEAEQAQLQASQADLAALQIVVAAQVADTYTQFRGIQARLQLAQAAERNQLQTLSLVERRVAAGSGTDLDMSRAQAQWQSTQARMPGLQMQMAVLQHRLAVLLGRSPGSLNTQLAALGPLPQLPSALDPGTPADVLRRRPDVAAAEARLHAATARIGVATADLFPRLSLGGVLGSFTLAGADLFTGRAAHSSVLFGIDWSFLDVGRVRARIDASEAGAAQALAGYQQQVLLALEEVENSLVQVQRNSEEWRLLGRVTQQRDKAEQWAQLMYRSGALGLFEVLDAQSAQLQAQDSQVQSQVNALRSGIALYKALAGGWPATAALNSTPSSAS